MTKAPHWTWILYGFVVALFYFPLLGMGIGAFTEKVDGQTVWSLKWVMEVLEDPALLEALWNSLLVALTASLFSTVVGTSAALAISKSRAWDTKLVQSFSYVTLFLPEIVMALSLLCLFFVLQWPLGFTTVVVAHVTLTLSFVILTVGARLSLLDRSLEDAAADLGANEKQILISVIWPLIRPAVTSGFVVSFLISFDDFLITFFVSGVGQETLPLKLYSAMKLGISPKLNALSVMILTLTAGLIVLFFRNSGFRALLRKNER